jgi:hypothetical protein
MSDKYEIIRVAFTVVDVGWGFSPGLLDTPADTDLGRVIQYILSLSPKEIEWPIPYDVSQSSILFHIHIKNGQMTDFARLIGRSLEYTEDGIPAIWTSACDTFYKMLSAITIPYVPICFANEVPSA